MSRTPRILTLILAWLLPLISDAKPLEWLREDLMQGDLRVLLPRLEVDADTSDLKAIVAATPITEFAVTGYAEKASRFAARVRFHFENRSTNFLRIEGHYSSGSYAITDWYDYALGWHLSDLVALKPWLESGEGRAFLSALNSHPDSLSQRINIASLPPAATALWLLQCGGRPCYDAAIASLQPRSSPPALWHLEQAVQADDGDYRAHVQKLNEALDAPAWIAVITGRAALRYQQCTRVYDYLYERWRAAKSDQALADTTLQCSLSTEDASTQRKLLGELRQAFPELPLQRNVRRFYREQGRPLPPAMEDWFSEVM